MKEKIVDFFINHGFKIMVTGFAISAAGVIMYMQMKHKNPLLEKIAFWVTFGGVGIYVIGRICVIIQGRHARKLRQKALADSAEKENA